jgi:magnesium chelatase subunit I
MLIKLLTQKNQMELEELQSTFLKKDIAPSVLGQSPVKKQITSALLTGRHLIIVGPPGVGKTTLAKDIAALLPDITVDEHELDMISLSGEKPSKSGKKKKIPGEKRFVRIQGSPDLTAEDLIGDIDPMKAMKYGPLSVEAFTPGKIFKAHKGILFFDEVNRCSEKLQNALLQVLEEGRATIGSYDVDFLADFIFIGTMNPKDFSTENLSDVFLDRFDLVTMGYPETLLLEQEIVMQKAHHLLNMNSKQNKELYNSIVAYVRSLRNSQKLEKFPSVRATIGVVERTQANALIAGRAKMIIDDFYEAMDSVLAHRIKLKPSVKYLQSPAEVLNEEFKAFAKANNIDLETMSQDNTETPEEDSGESG